MPSRSGAGLAEDGDGFDLDEEFGAAEDGLNAGGGGQGIESLLR